MYHPSNSHRTCIRVTSSSVTWPRNKHSVSEATFHLVFSDPTKLYIAAKGLLKESNLLIASTMRQEDPRMAYAPRARERPFAH